MTDLDELERLLAAATPGVWYADCEQVWVVNAEQICDCYGDLLTDNAALIVAFRNTAPAMIAEIKALRENARANNYLARMYKIQADELRGKCAMLADTLDYIEPSLPVLRDMLKRAKMPRGANQASDMHKVCEAALAQYRRASAMSELIALSADEYDPQPVAKGITDD